MESEPLPELLDACTFLSSLLYELLKLFIFLATVSLLALGSISQSLITNLPYAAFLTSLFE